MGSVLDYWANTSFVRGGLRFYTGVDIAERSIESARERLRDKKEHTRFLFADADWHNVSDADIFVSQACIQHFPSQRYLDDFLGKVNNMNADVVMLQIAHSRCPKFASITSKVSLEKSIVRACTVPASYIETKLTNFNLVKQSAVKCAKDYLFLTFHKK